jgi:hypothetical protein
LRDAAARADLRAKVQLQFVGSHTASLSNFNCGNTAYADVKLLKDRKVNRL